MSLKFRLDAPFQVGAAAPTVARKSLSIPLGIRGFNTVSSSTTETDVLRAVAAAAALCDPAEAIGLAGTAVDRPEEVIDPDLNAAALTKLKELLREVATYSAGDDGNAAITDSHKAVANAVSVGAGKVAVAHAKLEDDADACSNALKWVASINAGLLEKAARAGAREAGLNLVPTEKAVQEDLGERVESLEASSVARKKDITALSKRVKALEKTDDGTASA